MWTVAPYRVRRDEARTGFSEKHGREMTRQARDHSRYVSLVDILPAQQVGEPESWREMQVRNNRAVVWVSDALAPAVRAAGLPVWEFPITDRIGDHLNVADRRAMRDVMDDIGYARAEYAQRLRDGDRQVRDGRVFEDNTLYELLLFNHGGGRQKPARDQDGNIVLTNDWRECNPLPTPPAVGAFGDYATLLDNFNRTNEDPATGWATLDTGSNVIQVISNVARDNVSDADIHSYWTAASSIGPDVEAYMDIVTLDSANGDIDRLGVIARVQQPGGSTWDGYITITTINDTDKVEIFEVTNDSATQLGADISATINAGDKFGIQCIGTAIDAYGDTGGGWSSLGSRTDSTHSSAGYVANLWRDDSFSSNWEELDNFYAGTIPTVTWDQDGFRFYDDDNTNVNAATALAAEDTDIGRGASDPFQIRFQIDATDDPAGSETFKIQFRKSGGSWEDMTVG